MTHLWPTGSPAGITAQVDTRAYPSVSQLLADRCARHARWPAYRFLGKSISFETLHSAASALAAWFQGQGLQRGDRVAVMMPNVPQMPVTVAAILRVGGVVVPIDPQLSGRALAFQLKDSGARSAVLFEHCAAAVQAVLPLVPQLTASRLVIAAMGDMLGPIKGSLVNYMERNKRHAVPPYELPKAVRFNDALSQGQPLPLMAVGPRHDDLALLQYSIREHGPCKAAVLLHRNLVASVMQTSAWLGAALDPPSASEQATAVCALPLHSAFGFHLGLLLSPFLGLCCVLVNHPEDVPGLNKELADETVQGLFGSRDLFDAAARQVGPMRFDGGDLRLCLNAGPPVTASTHRAWQARTDAPILQGYGLCEAGPFVAATPLDTLGFGEGRILPLPGTEVAVLDTEGRRQPTGTSGEIAVRGPQVMAGYWQRPDETTRVMTAQGFLRTGDWGELDEAGGLTILDEGRDHLRRDEGLLLMRPELRSPR